MSVSPLGDLLVNYGLITAEDRSTITRECGRAAQSFAKSILSLGIMGESDLPQLMKKAAGTKIVSRDELLSPSPDAAGYLDSNIMSRLEVIPVALENGKLIVAMLDPTDLDAVAQVEFFARMPVVAAAAKFSDLKMGLTKQLGKKFQPSEPELARFLHRYKSRSVSPRAGAQSGQRKSISQTPTRPHISFESIKEREKKSTSSKEVSKVNLQDELKQSSQNETVVGVITNLAPSSLQAPVVTFEQPSTISEQFQPSEDLDSGPVNTGTTEFPPDQNQLESDENQLASDENQLASDENQLASDESHSPIGSLRAPADVPSELSVLQNELSELELEPTNSQFEENTNEPNLAEDSLLNREIDGEQVFGANEHLLSLEENQILEPSEKQQNIRNTNELSIANDEFSGTALLPAVDTFLEPNIELVSEMTPPRSTDEQSNTILESLKSDEEIAEASIKGGEENNVFDQSQEPVFSGSLPNQDERNSSDLIVRNFLSQENSQIANESDPSDSAESTVFKSGNHSPVLTHLNHFTSEALIQGLPDDVQIDRLDDFHKPGAVSANFDEIKLQSEPNEIEEIMLDEKDSPRNSRKKITSRQLLNDKPGLDVDELGVALNLKQGTEKQTQLDRSSDSLIIEATSIQEKKADETIQTKSLSEANTITSSSSLTGKRSTASLQNLDTPQRRIAPDKATGAINHASASLLTADSFHEACQLIANAMLSAGASEGYFVLFAGNSTGFAWSRGNVREVNNDEIRLAENVKHTTWNFDGRVHSILIEQQSMKIAILAAWEPEVPTQIQQASLRLFKNLMALSFAPSF